MTKVPVTALAEGFIAFLAVWGVVLAAQLIVHKVRFGRIVKPRVATTAAVVGYACLGLAVVLLPLPGPHTRHLAQGVQLEPFNWLADVQRQLRGSSLLDAITTPAFEQMALNVVLFVPLGIITRLLWRRGFVGTIGLGFACSLLIELTQLTANWGTAPFQYRIFDVDDLITNTAGAALGWIAGALFVVWRASVRRPEPERVHLTEAR